MQSITSAAALLAASDSAEALEEILAELGFPEPPLPLDPLACERLGIPYGVATAHVTRAEGALRALILTVAPDISPRDVLAKVAARFTARVPHLLWMVIVFQPEKSLVAFATWSAHTSPPRVLALVADRKRIVDSDAETLCTLSASSAVPGDVMRHARWLDVLGREAVTQRFYRALEQVVTTLADSLEPRPRDEDARQLALLYVSRLLFLAFLETKGWLNHDFGFLINGFADCMAQGGRYQQRVLVPLFFGTLNTRPTARATRAHAFGKIPFLNGGLFSRTPLEQQLRNATFTDEALGIVYSDLLGRYRFTAREDTTVWSEAAVDPEMLGKAFESLMQPQERKRSGSFYTPQPLVERITAGALADALQSELVPKEVVEQALAGNVPDSATRGVLLDRTSTLRILDPACGSGAFLVHALEQVAALRARLGDLRPLAAIRRSILTTSVHGVDINPMAVWLCELRLWLSTVIESDERDPMRVLPLPNLDHQIHVGDTLAGGSFDSATHPHDARSVAALRQRYARAHGPKKRILGKLLERTERSRAIEQLDRALTRHTTQRRELLSALRGRDLFAKRSPVHAADREQLATLRETIRHLQARRRRLVSGGALPFTFTAHCTDAADAGGFDVILGNPPWVRVHHIAPTDRATLRSSFSTFRDAAWTEGATRASAGTGFASQIDLAALFLERSIDLLTPRGTLGLLLPAKLWRSLAGGGTRRLLQARTELVTLEDFTDSVTAFNAAVYPSIVIARKTAHVSNSTPVANSTPVSNAALVSHSAPAPVPTSDSAPTLTPSSPTTSMTLPAFATVIVHRAESSVQWRAPMHAFALDSSAGSPWLIVPPAARAAFDYVSRAGVALVHSTFGRPYMGVKTGCNDAFLVDEVCEIPSNRSGDRSNDTIANETIVSIKDATYQSEIERVSLRPIARGETVHRWGIYPTDERIIWTHDRTGDAHATLPPLTERWLSRWRSSLEDRTDLHGNAPWWSLFRVDSADPTQARVVWSDFGRAPRATVLAPGDSTVPLNTCYVARCPTLEDAYALAALLNAPLTAAWLGAIAEPARGGHRRHLGWTMALLPIPRDWGRARASLAPIAERAMRGHLPTGDELHGATLAAYRLRADAVEPLMVWNAR